MDQKCDRVRNAALKDSVDRAIFLSYVLAALFGVYGLSSIDFIQKFDPSVTLWSNIWPRILFNSLPFFLLGLFTRKSTISSEAKLLVWFIAFATIFHTASWIHVWPIALWKSPEIMPYAHAANVFLIAVVIGGIAPPKAHLWRFLSVFFVVFLIPLLIVIYSSGDKTILKTVANDLVSVIVSIFLLSRTIEKLRTKVTELEIEKELEASKFLGPVVSKAIYNNERDRLNRIRCRAFIVCMDIRGSTDLQQLYGEKWLDFRRSYFDFVSQQVLKHGGYLQKTVGDCHVINFGVMDYGTDLSDIDGIEDELAQEEDNRLTQASLSAFSFIDEVLENFTPLAQQWFEGKKVYLGAGIDKGWVERSVQGHGTSLELDVNGDAVNCSNRLQEYSKILLGQGAQHASVLVVSPFASDYLNDIHKFERVPTEGNPVRNFAKIPWVLVKRYHECKIVKLAA
ncbi:MAG TPA: adenylate/guanylate cyclase domain-containing protein [Bacteriovoracaceae bacterium]|nr:adenylate/guanylate cyclase domain-containing protein [Bacteriovoracaceae bacterium]